MNLAAVASSSADGDFYEPVERATDHSREYRPNAVPSDWQEARLGNWRSWERLQRPIVAQGWKIHVSTTMDRAQQVLDLVAPVCFAAEVAFKHLATESAFIFAHHKHGPRPQAGKFCAIYPPDVATARQLLEQLAAQLRDEEGPYILSDRRYRDSRTVHYRYGAFRPTTRVRPDGSTEHLVRDGSGRLVPDVRSVSFVLPAGITDPFAEERPQQPDEGHPPSQDGIWIGDFRVLSPLAQSNAGGAYRAVDRAGEPVFLKEARAHNGLFWDLSTAQQRLRREYEVLTELHSRAPGLAPAPVAYFREWENEFLVTELVPGQPLYHYFARKNPYIQPVDADGFTGYFTRCQHLLKQLAAALDRLHECGYRFSDINPFNILVTEEGLLRLIDFEACNRLDEEPLIMGAPGYMPEGVEQWQGFRADEYGLSAIALAMLLPIHQHAKRHSGVLAHLKADLDRQAREYAGGECATVPPTLWQLAISNYPSSDDTPETSLPTVEQVTADPIGQLRWLHGAVARDLALAGEPDAPYRVFPSIPRGYATNTLCIAYGAAGVLHALHHAGLPIDERIVERLRCEALQQRIDLPPGLHFGTAGVGWVLAELGHLTEATTLVAAAAAHPLAAESATWGTGKAGIGAAHLALHAYTGDSAHLDAAAQLGDALCKIANLAPSLGPANARGLLHGRAGVALFLHQLWRATGDKRYLSHGSTVLHAELDLAVAMPNRELGFNDDDRSTRVMTYLGTGAAGVGHALTRYAHTGGDERFADAADRVLSYANKRLTVEPGLYYGLAGLAFAHADHADLAAAGDPASQARAIDLATGLFKYATPAGAGRVRFLGEGGLRFSTELWSGSGGILLALDRVLNGDNGQFFTLEHLRPTVSARHEAVRTGNRATATPHSDEPPEGGV